LEGFSSPCAAGRDGAMGIRRIGPRSNIHRLDRRLTVIRKERRTRVLFKLQGSPTTVQLDQAVGVNDLRPTGIRKDRRTNEGKITITGILRSNR
jgi:hypothetical protein